MLVGCPTNVIKVGIIVIIVIIIINGHLTNGLGDVMDGRSSSTAQVFQGKRGIHLGLLGLDGTVAANRARVPSRYRRLLRVLGTSAAAASATPMRRPIAFATTACCCCGRGKSGLVTSRTVTDQRNCCGRWKEFGERRGTHGRCGGRGVLLADLGFSGIMDCGQ